MGQSEDYELQVFIDTHCGRLIGLLRFRGSNLADAQELAQQLVDNWDHVRSLDNPWAWLLRAAINHSLPDARAATTITERANSVVYFCLGDCNI